MPFGYDANNEAWNDPGDNQPWGSENGNIGNYAGAPDRGAERQDNGSMDRQSAQRLGWRVEGAYNGNSDYVRHRRSEKYVAAANRAATMKVIGEDANKVMSSGRKKKAVLALALIGMGISAGIPSAGDGERAPEAAFINPGKKMEASVPEGMKTSADAMMEITGGALGFDDKNGTATIYAAGEERDSDNNVNETADGTDLTMEDEKDGGGSGDAKLTVEDETTLELHGNGHEPEGYGDLTIGDDDANKVNETTENNNDEFGANAAEKAEKEAGQAFYLAPAPTPGPQEAPVVTNPPVEVNNLQGEGAQPSENSETAEMPAEDIKNDEGVMVNEGVEVESTTVEKDSSKKKEKQARTAEYTTVGTVEFTCDGKTYEMKRFVYSGGYIKENDPWFSEGAKETPESYGPSIRAESINDTVYNWLHELVKSPQQITRLRVQMGIEDLKSLEAENAYARELARKSADEYDRIANETVWAVFDGMGGAVTSRDWDLENFMSGNKNQELHGRKYSDDDRGKDRDLLFTLVDKNGKLLISNKQGYLNTANDARTKEDHGYRAFVNADEGGTWKWKKGGKVVTATPAPTEKPTEAPTEKPTKAPTEKPTKAPTNPPTNPPEQKKKKNGDNLDNKGNGNNTVSPTVRPGDQSSQPGTGSTTGPGPTAIPPDLLGNMLGDI